MPRVRYDLYYTLNVHLENTPLSSSEEELFWTRWALLSRAQVQAALLLTYEHFLVTSAQDEVPDPLTQLPYRGKQSRRGTTFDFYLFPPELQRLLYKFLEVVNADEKAEASDVESRQN